MEFTYRFVGEVERVFGHLAHRGTGPEGQVYGNADVAVDGQPVDADANQTVELHPGDDVVVTTDEPQSHPELVPTSPDALAAAEQPPEAIEAAPEATSADEAAETTPDDTGAPPADGDPQEPDSDTADTATDPGAAHHDNAAETS